MNITLRKASTLQNSINDALKHIEIKTDASLTEFHEVEFEIEKSVNELKHNIQRRNALTQALYAIRLSVSDVNHVSGINAKLTELARLEKQIQFYTGLAGKEVRENLTVLTGKLQKMKNADAKHHIYGYNETVTTSVLDKEYIAEFKKTLSDLKKAKQKLQDEVLEANVRNGIVLNDVTITTLQSEGLL